MAGRLAKRLRPSFPLLAIGFLSLLVGIWTGLGRLGWELPFPEWNPTAYHGPLMVSGFIGTLISLERAVALRKRWAFAAPLLTGIGGIGLIAGLPYPLGHVLITAGSLGAVAIFAYIFRLQKASYTGLMLLASSLWVMGNVMWLAGRPVYAAMPWWVTFLVLMIVGERVELSRFMRPPPQARMALYLFAALCPTGLLISVFRYDTGIRLIGLSFIVLSLWLLRYDIARRTVRQQGVAKFIAVGLLSGYVWLGVGGLLSVALGGDITGQHYDAIIHSIALGFVISMVFAHAPVILPSILGKALSFHPRAYAHLALLHVSLLLRISADISGWPMGKYWGGMLNAIALLIFLFSSLLTLFPLTRRG